MSEIGQEFVIRLNKWEKNALFVREHFSTYIDWEERFYECPFCGEPVYECDWCEALDTFICLICEDEEGY